MSSIIVPNRVIRFFVPVITQLRENNKLFLLCLSNGNHEGLGRIREKELEKSCKALQFEEAPTIIDDPDLQDGPNNHWAPALVAEHIERVLKTKAADKEAIDMIVTFDDQGVSGHPNHIDVHNGLKHLNANTSLQYDFMTLESVNIVRKYSSYADIMLCNDTRFMLFFSANPIESYRALALHASQFVWFRKLFVVFSRYTFVNSMERFIRKPGKRSVAEEIK